MVVISVIFIAFIVIYTFIFFKNENLKKYNIHIKKNNKIVNNKLYLNLVKYIDFFILKNDLKISKKKAIFLFFLISAIFFFFSFVISMNFFKLFFSSLILSLYTFFVPYIILKFKYYKNRNEIYDEIPNFLVSLKNYTKVNNDIIYALNNVNADKKLKRYIDKFNVSIKNGLSVYTGFENLKKDLNIPKFTELIVTFQSCYISGGDYNFILEKYINLFNKFNIQKEKEEQENITSVLILIVMIVINILIFLFFIKSNEVYYKIIYTTMIGRIILDLNILTYFFVFRIMFKLKFRED